MRGSRSRHEARVLSARECGFGPRLCAMGSRCARPGAGCYIRLRMEASRMVRPRARDETRAPMSRHTITSGLDALFLRRMAARLDRGAAAAVRGHGLTVDQWRMLDLLASTGPLPMAALCEELSLAGATATRVADRLVVEALAYRSIDDTDRRRVVLGASERGLELREIGRAHV